MLEYKKIKLGLSWVQIKSRVDTIQINKNSKSNNLKYLKEHWVIIKTVVTPSGVLVAKKVFVSTSK